MNYGSFVKPRPHSYDKSGNESDEINVLASVEANPNNSCRDIERSVGVPRSKVQQILKKHKYKPYKFRVIQHLRPGDAIRRTDFCNWFLQMVNADSNFSSKVIWSDESYFGSSGIMNRHNSRHWSNENHHVVWPRERQGRFGFSVSCFILGTNIKFYIFEGGLTGNRHLEILENIIPQLIDEIPLASLNRIYYQQDGAPAHNAQVVRPFLEEHFGDHLITTNGPIRWPPRSPDLSILDFFLWGYLQNKIYTVQFERIEDLRGAVEREFRALQAQPLIILNSLRRIKKNCEMCIRQQGHQFEQFL